MGVHAGSDLKKLLLEANGDFTQLELKVKRWHESRRTAEAVEQDVTKQQLMAAPHFWTEPVPQDMFAPMMPMMLWPDAFYHVTEGHGEDSMGLG